VERTFAWEDKFKRLLLRFERIQKRHYGMKLMAYTMINLPKSDQNMTQDIVLFEVIRVIHPHSLTAIPKVALASGSSSPYQ
jgi:hypothetical protein